MLHEFTLPLIFRSFDKRLLTAMVDGTCNLNNLVRDNLVTICGFDVNSSYLGQPRPISESSIPRAFHFLQCVYPELLIRVAQGAEDLNRLAQEELDQRGGDAL